jgi:hypothetical protein
MYSSLDPRLTMNLAQAESERIFPMPGYETDSELTMELFPSTSMELFRTYRDRAVQGLGMEVF